MDENKNPPKHLNGDLDEKEDALVFRTDPTSVLPNGEEDEATTNLSKIEKETKIPGYITANPATYKWVKKFRVRLKQNPTEAEQLLWKFLRNNKTGHKIRRQHVIGDFIADFVCLPKKVIIEIDGEIHKKQKIEDNIRTIALNNLGYQVIRFNNEEIFLNPAAIAAKIKAYLDSQPT